jgi:ABC-type sugar transport system ATPase subunit
LESCHIAEYRRTYPSELSGGEQQRLAIARALAPAPPLLLLDEPLANLDAGLRERMLNLFQEQKRRGSTIVFATHDRGEAEALGDSTLIMIRQTVA